MSEWSYKSLDQMGTISRGKSKHRPRNDARLFGGEYPFIQTGDIGAAGLYVTEYSQTYNEEGLAQSKLWDKDTLCITIAANIADTALLAFPACFPDSIMGFVPFKKVADVKFVKYCFDILQKDCQQISQGTAQDNLSWKKLSTIMFPCPPIEIQHRIATILSRYDNLIENYQKQIKLLEEAAQRLYKEWFVDLRFPGYEEVKMVDGLPEGWAKRKLVDVAKLKAGGDKPEAFSNEKTEELTIPVFSNGTVNEGLYGYTNIAEVNEPSVTISARGSIGFTVMRRVPYVPIVRLISIIPIDVYVGYLYFFIKGMPLDGNGAAQQQITVPMVKNKEIIIPTHLILKAFEKEAEPLFIMVENLKNQIRFLAEARDRLLPRLMGGEMEIEI